MKSKFVLLFLLVWSFSATAGVSPWIPFDSDSGHISIPVTLNGVETTAILDSGASGNAISETFLAENEGSYTLGPQVRVAGINGTRKVRTVDGIEIGMFGAGFKIDQLMPVRAYGYDLIIGLSFFKNFVLQIDYPNSQLRIVTHDVINLKKIANVKMRKSASDSQPIVKVNMNGEANLWLTLDTGNNTGILIPRRSALRFDWMDKYGTEDSQLAGVNEVADVERFNVPEITLGPFTLENVIVIVPAEGEQSNVGKKTRLKTGTRVRKKEDSDGILGYDVLKHFVVTIDFKRSKLHIAPPAE